MNKKEQAAFEALKTELAFRWPTEAEPAPMTRVEIEAGRIELHRQDNSAFSTRRAALGWFCNTYNGEISQGWSNGMFHSRHNITGDNGSRDMGVMYRTKREAALACRWGMCREMAKKLRAIDAILEAETPAGAA